MSGEPGAPGAVRPAGGPLDRDRSAWFPAGARDGPPLPRLVDGLITRRVLFEGRPRGWVRLSPDGRSLAWVEAAHGTGNAWIAPRDDLGAARPVSPFRRGSIVELKWGHDNRHLIVVRDVTGEENDRIHSVDVVTGKVVDLVAAPGVQARLELVSPRMPKRVLVSANERDRAWHDWFIVDLRTGARRLLLENWGFARAITDPRYAVRLIQARDGSYVHPEGKSRVPLDELESGDHVLGFDAQGEALYSIGRGFSGNRALIEITLEPPLRRVLSENASFDVDGVLLHPTLGIPQAVSWLGERPWWTFLDSEVAVDFEALAQVEEGAVHIASRSVDDRWWVVAFDRDDAPVRYFLYDRRAKRAERLFAHNSALEGLPLAPMRSVAIKARDRMTLPSYLTMPNRETGRRPAQPLPTVLLVHGGPHHRDSWGYDTEHQWLASRGYAVLSVNFRGSTGFGRSFLEAGRREWGAKMQEDLLDAADWAIEQGIAKPDRIAIMGASYGGYAALAGLTLSPERFACGVAFAGPSNLVTTVLRIPPYWNRRAEFSWIGDPRHPAQRERMLERSPSERADRVQRPLLVGHGANDPRVPRAESDQMVGALRRASKQVTYLLFFDEGHGLSRSSNRLAFYGVAEAFLAQHLGGRAEPFEADLEQADVMVLAGAEHIPGLRRPRQRSPRPGAAAGPSRRPGQGRPDG